MKRQKFEKENPPNGYRNHFENSNGQLMDDADHLNDPNGRCCIHDGCDIALKENLSSADLKISSSIEKLIKKLENCKHLADHFLIPTPIENINEPIIKIKFEETFKKLQIIDGVEEETRKNSCGSKNCTNNEILIPEKNKNDELFLPDDDTSGIQLIQYKDETQMADIMRLITRDLSEPYSIYTYRYFIHNWPHLCFLAKSIDGKYVGAIVCKLSLHARGTRRGYIAMLAVDEQYRRQKIGTRLVTQAIETMLDQGCDEVVLETEVTNKSAMKLYENLGFARDKRLFRYYLNGVDAFRLKLWLKPPQLVQYL